MGAAQRVLADIPRGDQSDNDVPALPGYQYPDKTQQNNLMPDPYVPQERPQTLPRLPTGSDPYEALPDEADQPASDSTTGVPESIGSEPFAGASALSALAEGSAFRAAQALGIESELSDEVGENAVAPELAPEENTVYPMDNTPEDDEQELNELYDASREDNNLGSPGSTTSGTPNLNQHASQDPQEEATADDPDAASDGAYPDMVNEDPLGEDATPEDMLLLGEEDDLDTEPGIKFPSPGNGVPNDADFPLDSAEVKISEVRGMEEPEAIGYKGKAEAGVSDTLVPTMEPQNGVMQTPLGVDATAESNAGILRDPYANKKDEVEASDETVASLEYPEEDDEPQFLLDPDGSEFHTEINSDGVQEEDPYTYDMGEQEVSAEDSDESQGASGGEHEDADAASASDIQGLSSKEKNVLFDSLATPGSLGASVEGSKVGRALLSSSAVPYMTLADLGRLPSDIEVDADEDHTGEDPQAGATRQANTNRSANAKTWNTVKKVVNQFTRGRALINEEEGAITFSTDVQGLAFVAALGLAGVKMLPYKPGQVVREGRDTVHQAVLPGGARLVFNFDVRGFIDKVVLTP
ncbi:hypothetical protein D3C87_1186400 [compost metagenome]